MIRQSACVIILQSGAYPIVVNRPLGKSAGICRACIRLKSGIFTDSSIGASIVGAGQSICVVPPSDPVVWTHVWDWWACKVCRDEVVFSISAQDCLLIKPCSGVLNLLSARCWRIDKIGKLGCLPNAFVILRKVYSWTQVRRRCICANHELGISIRKPSSQGPSIASANHDDLCARRPSHRDEVRNVSKDLVYMKPAKILITTYCGFTIKSVLQDHHLCIKSSALLQ